MSSDLHLDRDEVALLIDLYELTMAASYLEHGFNEPACFSLSVRRLPQRREPALDAPVARSTETTARSEIKAFYPERAVVLRSRRAHPPRAHPQRRRARP